jgi:AraC-like DNA-binding protein
MACNPLITEIDSTASIPWQSDGRLAAESEVCNLLRTAATELRHDPGEARSYLQRAISLIDAECNPRARAVSRPKGGLAGWQARMVRTYINENIGALIRTSQLASLATLSVSHFSRAFKQTFGETPSTYIARRRVDLARHLLLSGDKQLSDIALDCGLCDQSHLSRVFKRFVGTSPLQWRRRVFHGSEPLN